MPRHYPGLIEPAATGTGFGVLFPDFPGCASAGPTADLALANASSALQFHILQLGREGRVRGELEGPDPVWLH